MSLSARRAWIEIPSGFTSLSWSGSLSARRAWIEIFHAASCYSYFGSLSARRAWIEMRNVLKKETGPIVALRKESVDRNFHHNLNLPSRPMSLSARRAWIEI